VDRPEKVPVPASVNVAALGLPVVFCSIYTGMAFSSPVPVWVRSTIAPLKSAHVLSDVTSHVISCRDIVTARNSTCGSEFTDVSVRFIAVNTPGLVVGVGVGVGVEERETEGVGVIEGVGVREGVTEGVGEVLAPGLFEGVGVIDGVGVFVGVIDGVGVLDGVRDGVGVLDGVDVGVIDGVGVTEGVTEGVGVVVEVGVGDGRELNKLTKYLYSVNLGVLETFGELSSPFATSILLPENSPVNLGDSSLITFVIKLPLGDPTVIV